MQLEARVLLIGVTFFLLIIFTKNINTEGKTRDSTATGEHIRRRKIGKWKKLKRGKLEIM